MPGSARISGQSRLEAVRGGRAEHVDRIRHRCLARKRRCERRARLLGELRQVEPSRLAGVGAEDPEPAGVREHGDTAPSGDGLAGEQGGDVEQPGERVGPDHPCLAEDGVDGGVRAGEGRGVGSGCLLAGARPTALHREHGLLAGEAPRDAGELAGVAERLDVQQDEVGAGVVLPPFEQVVRRDVGLVADRHERREAEPAGLGPLEEGEPERAGLRGEADSPGRERARREGGVEADGGGGDAEAVRADEARAVSADEGEQLVLSLDAFGPRLGEACRDDAEGARAGAQRFLRGVDHALARQADDAQVDRIGDLLDRAVGADPGDGLAGAVDRVGGAGEPSCEDVAEQLAADRAAARRGTDHGNRRRLEERSQRGGHGDVVTLVDARLVAGSVASIENLTSTTPPSRVRVARKPMFSKTESITWFSGSTSAMNASMP